MKRIILQLVLLLPLGVWAQYNYNWAYALGSSSNEGCYGLSVDQAGNVIITGAFHQTIDFDFKSGVANRTSAGSGDIFIAKYDPDANLHWAHQIGSASGENGWTVTTDAQHNVYAIGDLAGSADFDPSTSTALLTPISSAGYVAKYDANGNYQWAFLLEATTNELLYGVTTDRWGNVYVTGTFHGSMDCDPGSGTATIGSSGQRDVFVAKYDANGNYKWAFALGSTTNDYGWDLVTDSLSNVYAVGYFGGTVDFDPSSGSAQITAASGGSAYLAKYDSSGNYVWAGAVVGTGGSRAYAVDIDHQGDVFMCGLFTSTADMDIQSGTSNIVSAGQDDIFVGKYDPNGNHLWSFAVGGTSDDEARDIAVDHQGRIAITGWIDGIADMDPGSGTQNLVPNIRDGIIAKYDGSGNYIWAGNMGGVGSGGVSAFGVGVTPTDIYACGFFGGGVSSDFDAGTGVANLSPAGSNDVFLVRYTDVLVSDKRTERRDQVTMFPNPVNGGDIVSVDARGIMNEIIVYSLTGSIVLRAEGGKQEINLNTRGLPSGLYVVEVSVLGGSSERMPLVIQ